MGKPEALRLADELDQYLYSVPAHPLCTDAAVELRRLHADNERIRSTLNGWIKENSPGGWIDDLRTQRDALLDALRSIADCCDEEHAARDYASRQAEIRGVARAAIKAVEEGK